ncbi:39S ribosomal protein L46 [Dirofilaria immitis]
MYYIVGKSHGFNSIASWNHPVEIPIYVPHPKYEQHICFTLQTCRFSKADSKSLKRKIDEFLVLIVCQKFDREDSYHLPWHLPQLQNLPGESLKQTSIRCLKELFSIEMYGKGITNAPFSVYVYHYPAQLRRRLKTSSRGAAIFFFKAMYMKHIPLIANRDEVADYKWVSAEEFAANLKYTMSYLQALSTLFPSSLLAKNSFGCSKGTGSQKTQPKMDIQTQSF